MGGALQHLARELAGMPNLGHTEARNDREGIGPESTCAPAIAQALQLAPLGRPCR